VAVVNCLHNEEVAILLKKTLNGEVSASDASDESSKPDETQVTKDRDNVFVLVQELLKNEVRLSIL
jgi:hypothetical protein